MITVSQAEYLIREHLGHERYVAAREVAHEGEPDGIGIALIIALGIRETGLRNIEGDGGHGQGWLQIDDRSFRAFLTRSAGCRNGTWKFVKGHRAIEPGYVPGLTAGEHCAIQLLRGNMAYGKTHGVRHDHLLHFAVTAYNCGAGNALAAYKRYGITGIDAYTTGRNYGHDVLAMRTPVNAALKRLHWPTD
jgi:hypothetical protein